MKRLLTLLTFYAVLRTSAQVFYKVSFSLHICMSTKALANNYFYCFSKLFCLTRIYISKIPCCESATLCKNVLAVVLFMTDFESLLIFTNSNCRNYWSLVSKYFPTKTILSQKWQINLLRLNLNWSIKSKTCLVVSSKI